jgi:Zn-dependent peptidase ImmA (M78 family)/transcriptional regulator with XRE-family HTH domain
MTDNNVVHFPSAGRAAHPGRRLIPARLRDARKALRMTQDELGGLTGVTRQAISAFEAGSKSPDSDTFGKIVGALMQPYAFFTNEDRPTFGECGPYFFRKAGPETIRRNDACSVLGNWFVQTVHYLGDFVNYPAVDLLDATTAQSDSRYTGDEIEGAAFDCRNQWGLGLGPISNMVALMESKGVAICRYEIEGERVDAFSFWNGDRPFVFMASEKDAGVRRRFDAAHELGHLILHKWIEREELADPKTLKRIEAEADRFAGAFLLPRKSFPNEVYTARLDAFLDLKRRWAVSVQAMIYRCRDLALIDDDQFTNLYKQISYRKWRSKEPLDDPSIIRIEQPKMLQKAAMMLVESGKKHPDEICAEIALDPQMLATFWNVPPELFAGAQQDNSTPTLK